MPRRLVTVAAALLVAGLLSVLLAHFEFFSSIGVLQRPAPREIPVAVVGPNPAAATTRDALNTLPGTPIAARAGDDRIDGERLLRNRSVSGVLIVGPAGRNELLLASAGGKVESDELRRTIGQALAVSGQRVVVRDLIPATDRDARGVASGRLAAGWVLFAVAAAAVITRGYSDRPAHLGRATLRIAVMVGLSIIAGITGTALSALVFRSFDPPWLPLIEFGTVLVAGVGLATMALIAWLGRAGVVIASVCFLLLGIPGAVGAYPLTPLPAVFATMIAWLPPGAGAWAVRSLIYFGASGIGRVTGLYVVWAVLGALLVFAGTDDGTGDGAEEARK